MAAHASQLQVSGWRGVFLLLMLGGVGATYLGTRFEFASTAHLGDPFPSGLCFGLDVFCGIALAAGALTIASAAYVIGGAEWKVVGRACLLAGVLGYGIALLGALANTYQVEGIWRTLLRGWSAGSLLSGAAWTVCILVLLLFIEFLPQCSLPAARSSWFAILARLDLPFVILAAVLAIADQHGLNRLIRSFQGNFSPLWTGPSLSPLFYLSSIALGLSILLVASWRSWLAFQKALPIRLQPMIARLLTVAVFVYLSIRLIDLMDRGLVWSIFNLSRESLLILLEILLLLLGMIWIHGSENQPREVFLGSALIIAGVMANRLDTAITALEPGMGRQYLPRWSEFLIAYTLIAAGIAGFALGVKHLSVFAEIEPSGN